MPRTVDMADEGAASTLLEHRGVTMFTLSKEEDQSAETDALHHWVASETNAEGHYQG